MAISWWNQFSTDTCKEWFPKIVHDFEQAYPNIKVDFEITGGPPGGGDFAELLLARIAAGNPPDTGQLWPDLPAATPPYALVVNVLPADVSPENGSTEIWLGTHLDTSISWQKGDIKVDPQRLEARQQVSPPIQPVAKAGSVVIRDIRLWHAGMPNYSDTPRPMIAMIHYVSWWSAADPVPFPKGTEAVFAHPHLITNARFVDGPIDYLRHNKAFDFKR